MGRDGGMDSPRMTNHASQPLRGKVAIVSGAARGLGAAFVAALRAAGAQTVGLDLRPGTDVRGDAGDAGDVRSFVDQVVADHGGIDIAVANAGIVRSTSPLDPWAQAIDDFDAQVRTNLRGVYLLGRAVAPIMVANGGGHIVNVSTDHLLRAPGVAAGGGLRMDAYDASKYGIRGLTDSWALSLRPHGVRVNELCIGATNTDMLREFLGTRATPDLVATWIDPRDIARVLVELIAEGPAGRTGTQIPVWVGHPAALPPQA